MRVLAWGGYVQIVGPVDLKTLRLTHSRLTFHPTDSSLVYFLTIRDKFEQLDDFQIISPKDCNLTMEEQNYLEKLTGPLNYYLHPISQKNYRIITFNLGYAIQLNKIRGSEALQVQICQNAYPEYQGWSLPNPYESEKILSACTNDAISWLAQQMPDCIGLQEVDSKYLPTFVSLLNSETNQNYLAIRSGTVALITNVERFGPGYLLSPPDLVILEKNRSIQLVWFPLTSTLIVNLHAPHHIPLEKSLKEIISTVPLIVQPDRIIAMGDFNDIDPSPLMSFEIAGKILKQPSFPPRSCCTNRPRVYGDYIFDSQLFDNSDYLYYGVPTEVFSLLMSDHDPVMYDAI